MSKRAREEGGEEEIFQLPRELKDYILKEFTGGIRSLCNFHLTEKYYYWKWKELPYQKKIVSEQKERNSIRFRATKHAYYFSNCIDYQCLEKALIIVDYLLDAMPVNALMTNGYASRNMTISFVAIDKFLASISGTTQTGTKTYPQTSSLLSQDQVYTMKLVQNYMLFVHGWLLGTERSGARQIKPDLSSIYLEHVMILSIPSK